MIGLLVCLYNVFVCWFLDESRIDLTLTVILVENISANLTEASFSCLGWNVFPIDISTNSLNTKDTLLFPSNFSLLLDFDLLLTTFPPASNEFKYVFLNISSS